MDIRLNTTRSAEAKEYFIDLDFNLINYFWQNKNITSDKVDLESSSDKEVISDTNTQTTTKKPKKTKNLAVVEIKEDNIDNDAITLAFD